MDIEEIIVAILVLLALGVLIFRGRLSVGSMAKGGCGSGCGCGKKELTKITKAE